MNCDIVSLNNQVMLWLESIPQSKGNLLSGPHGDMELGRGGQYLPIWSNYSVVLENNELQFRKLGLTFWFSKLLY